MFRRRQRAVVWAAKGENGVISIFGERPRRCVNIWSGSSYINQLYGEERLLPALAALRWEDEPIKIRLEVLK